MHPTRACFATLVPLITAGAMAATPSGADAERPAACGQVELRLVLFDPKGTATELHSGTLDEISRLLAPVDIRVEGRVGGPAGAEPQGTMVVVLLPRDPGQPAREAVAGACNCGTGGTGAVWAFPPVLAESLGLGRRGIEHWSAMQRRSFERALAHVVVHELAHVLADASHRREGLMAPRLRKGRLLYTGPAVDAELGRALRAGVARLAAGSPSFASVPPPSRRASASPRRGSGGP